MSSIQFGWRVPAFPVDGSNSTEFVEQVHHNLQQIEGKFDSAWVADHFIPWAQFQSDDTPTLECLTAITYLTALYPKLDFGSIVLCQSYRNPALLAKMTASLQWLSGGRFIFGIGAGWKQDEYEAYGYPFPRAGIRLAQLEETVEIVKRLWTETPATFEGKHYQIQQAWNEPKPAPRPPIMIGGGGEKVTLRIVARHADWWNFPGGTLENYSHKLDVLRQHCDDVGRDYNEIRKTWACERVAVGSSEADAKRIADASPFGGNNFLVGTAEQVADNLRQFMNQGVTYFMLRFCDFPHPEGALRFAEEVMPLLK